MGGAFDNLSAPGLFALRAAMARAVVATEEGKAPFSGPAPDPAALGLPDLGRWLELEAERGRPRPGRTAGTLVSRLLGFAGQARDETFARAALLAASRTARSAAEKRAVRMTWDAWEAGSPGSERARIAASLGRSRAAATTAESQERMAALVRTLPGSPETAPDLFEPADSGLLWAVVARGGPELRLLRARALSDRQPSAAAELALPLAKEPAHRLEAAALLLGGGRAKAARDALTKPSAFAGRDDAERLRAEALLLSADLRLLDDRPAAPPTGRRQDRKSPPRPPPVPGARRPPPTLAVRAAFRVLADRADILLARPLPEPEKRRLLSEAVRASARLGLVDETPRYVAALLVVEPSTTLGAEDLFLSAFLPTLSRSPEALRDAAAQLQRQADLYTDVSVRRRATYWAARCLESLGREAAARALYASLLSTAVPDLYARWAGARTGVPVSEARPLAAPGPATPHPLLPDARAFPSRELLAVGLASLAEDVAEAEGSAEPFFLAACAAERFEFRRATAILKRRWPALGTPDEGGLPLAVRRAYYPFRQEAVIVREAAASGLPAALVYGVIRQESLFQTDARSGAGATGLMQVMPGTGRYLLRNEKGRGRPDLRDPDVNVRLGARYLAMMLREFDGDRIAALAGYNAGPGRPRRWKREAPGLSADEFLEAMPFFETRDYVKRVLFFEAAYAVLHDVPVDPLPLAAEPVSPTT